MSRARPRAAESLPAPGRERQRHGWASCASFGRVAGRADDPEGTVRDAPQVMAETSPPSQIFPAFGSGGGDLTEPRNAGKTQQEDCRRPLDQWVRSFPRMQRRGPHAGRGRSHAGTRAGPPMWSPEARTATARPAKRGPGVARPGKRGSGGGGLTPRSEPKNLGHSLCCLHESR